MDNWLCSREWGSKCVFDDAVGEGFVIHTLHQAYHNFSLANEVTPSLLNCFLFSLFCVSLPLNIHGYCKHQQESSMVDTGFIIRRLILASPIKLGGLMWSNAKICKIMDPKYFDFWDSLYFVIFHWSQKCRFSRALWWHFHEFIRQWTAQMPLNVIELWISVVLIPSWSANKPVIEHPISL